jgi:hypothetical protein
MVTRITIRFNLRLTVLVVSLACTVFAWMSYRAVVNDHARRLIHENAVSRVTASEARITGIKRQIRDGNALLGSSDLQELPFLEVERALGQLEVEGFSVMKSGSMFFGQVTIVLCTQLTEAKTARLLTCLKLLRHTPDYSVTVDASRLRPVGDLTVDLLIKRMKSACPWTTLQQ